MRFLATTLAFLILAAVQPAAAAPGVFASFWRTFQAAAARGDRAAIARMTRLPFYFGTTITTAAELAPALDQLFPAAVRACFAHAKPLQDGGYRSVRCGTTTYGFDANEGTWQFSGVDTKG